ncbi:MAG: hypothetical protein EAX96_08580 [Candidatus Lokiarchaeota archaeon]|nr:hypothetical protein [Candidatus Lokiarchaeota archaeon]
MNLDFNNLNLIRTKIKELVKEVQSKSCDTTVFDELSNIMKTIGQDDKLYQKYKDIYEEAEDELMLAGADLEKCGCDPIKRQIPADKI